MAEYESKVRAVSLRDFVKLPLKFFSVVGIKVLDLDQVMATKEKMLLAVVCSIVVLSYLAGPSYPLFHRFRDSFQMTEWFLYVTFGVNSLVKVISVLLGRKTLNGTLKDLELLFPRNPKERRDFNLPQSYDYIMHHSNVMFKSHWIILMMFLLFPAVQTIVEYFLNGKFISHHPFIMNYPFEPTRGMGYAVVYIFEFITGCITGCFFVGTDILLICLVYLVVLQFKYLCFRLERFESESYEEDLRELKDILQKHILLNNLAENINGVFSVAILMNYIISILVIVLIGVQIVFSNDLLDLSKFMGFFIATTIQMYYVCMFGDQLMTYSALVGEKIAGQKWYMADKRYQRMVVMVIIRSQRPAHLTAYKFFTISMESFSNLMTTSYQFFTVLKVRLEDNSN